MARRLGVASASRRFTLTCCRDLCSYSAELLRVESPSAEVQGHAPGGKEKKLVSGKRPVGIMKVQPVGNYAVQLVFDDLHESGIYSWGFLYKLGLNKFAVMRNYLKELKRRGMTRNPRLRKKVGKKRAVDTPSTAM